MSLVTMTENFKQGSEYEHALASQRPGFREVSVHHACTSSMVHEVPTPTPSVPSPYFFNFKYPKIQAKKYLAAN
jgi:hypothetical protein